MTPTYIVLVPYIHIMHIIKLNLKNSVKKQGNIYMTLSKIKPSTEGHIIFIFTSNKVILQIYNGNMFKKAVSLVLKIINTLYIIPNKTEVLIIINYK